ncbi:hypothetical protein NV379_17410 [Paenibacillus sp. N1-5-1-14]|uniref:hypothetical protein n=1 Tax=Paenibacillus radicibacter TaxID=2972488 RepID=UPI00215991A4|nr:hypothetical protein [Paenibacillus radicibacter]MCR8644435.1 hypothetical protein [Paenibacillus radicibacter]
MKNPIFTVKNPSSLGLMIIMLLVAVYNGYGLLFDQTLDTEKLNLKTWLTILCSIYVVLAGYRTFISKKRELTLNHKSIMMGGTELQANDISIIMISYGKNPNIGIRPGRKLMVPMKWSFRYEKDQELGVQLLEQWAKANKVEVQRGQYMRWI